MKFSELLTEAKKKKKKKKKAKKRKPKNMYTNPPGVGFGGWYWGVGGVPMDTGSDGGDGGGE